jgi:hypothetical protein
VLKILSLNTPTSSPATAWEREGSPTHNYDYTDSPGRPSDLPLTIHRFDDAGRKESGSMNWSQAGMLLDLPGETRSAAHSASRTRAPDPFPEGMLFANCCSTTRNQYRPRRLRSRFIKRLWHRPSRVPLPQGHHSLFACRFLIASSLTKGKNSDCRFSPSSSRRSSAMPLGPCSRSSNGASPHIFKYE